MQVIIVGKEEIERLQYGFTVKLPDAMLIPDVELTEEANEKLWEGGEIKECCVNAVAGRKRD